MAALLVTLAQAKGHLYITDSDHDVDVQLKLDQAERIIVDYLKARATELTADTTPLAQAAILLMLGHLYEHRGDDMAPDAALWDAIDRLLKRRRDPTLA